MTIYLIGYQGRTPEGFVAALKEAGVTTLVDVRRYCFSHRPQFCKTALKNMVEAAGIGYRHLINLGPPADLMRANKANPNWPAFQAAYLSYLEQNAAYVEELEGLIGQGTVALMCMEADASQCHRSLLARHLVGRHDGEWTAVGL